MKNGCRSGKITCKADLDTVGLTGLVKKKLREYTSSIPGDMKYIKFSWHSTQPQEDVIHQVKQDASLPGRASGPFGHSCKNMQRQAHE